MSDYYSGELVETRLRREIDNLEQQVETLGEQVDRLTIEYLKRASNQDRQIECLEQEIAEALNRQK